MQKCLDEMRQTEAEQEGWVCVHCGKSTFEADYEHLFSPQEHIGCALKAEKEVGAQKEIRKVPYEPVIEHPEWLI